MQPQQKIWTPKLVNSSTKLSSTKKVVYKNQNSDIPKTSSKGNNNELTVKGVTTTVILMEINFGMPRCKSFRRGFSF